MPSLAAAVGRGVQAFDRASPRWALTVDLQDLDREHIVPSLMDQLYGGMDHAASMIGATDLEQFGLVDTHEHGRQWEFVVATRQETANRSHQ